jgi:hypothetical protein
VERRDLFIILGRKADIARKANLFYLSVVKTGDQEKYQSGVTCSNIWAINLKL